MTLTNYKTLLFFSKYNSTENSYIKVNNFAAGVDTLKISGSVDVSSLFELCRLCNLIFLVTGAKPFIQKQRSSFKVLIELSGYPLYKVLSKLYTLRIGPKSGFLLFRVFNYSSFVTVVEPHVVFSITSPYFDYHTSGFNLSLFSSVKKNPSFSYVLSWLFGI